MKIVALGGGHGTAVTLRALRSFTSDVTAIVSVADNGGSTGVLRDELDVAGVGDLRKCLLALAPESALSSYFEYRFEDGTFKDHAFGNLLLAVAEKVQGDLVGAVGAVGELLGISGNVYPASTDGVSLIGESPDAQVEGQVEVAHAQGIRKVRTSPESVTASDQALRAIGDADGVVLGPGSLFTSVLAALVVPGITDALRNAHAKVVFVANLDEDRETEGFSVRDQLDALVRHGVRVDVVLFDESSRSGNLEGILAPGEVRMMSADLRGAVSRVHDKSKLARSLAEIMAN